MRLKLMVKRGEALAQRLDHAVPDPMVVKLAADWHDEVYKLLAKERPDLAKLFLDETEAIVEIPTVSLGTINPACLVMNEQIGCLRVIMEQLEASQ